MEFSWDIIGIYYGMNEHIYIYTYIYIYSVYIYIYSVYGILYKNQLDMFLGVQLKIGGTIKCFFPTCQVRVVRFYQSCSLPPRLALLFLLLLLLRLLLLRLLLQFLLDHVCINFHLNIRLANSSPSSSPTSQLSAHCWPST